jgi:hypothetical protein
MTATQYTRILLATLCLLALAEPAAVEGAWVLWQRDDSFNARGALVSSPTEVFATYTTSAECITRSTDLSASGKLRWRLSCETLGPGSRS